MIIVRNGVEASIAWVCRYMTAETSVLAGLVNEGSSGVPGELHDPALLLLIQLFFIFGRWARGHVCEGCCGDAANDIEESQGSGACNTWIIFIYRYVITQNA